LADDIDTERECCAVIADHTVSELTGMRDGARRSHYDRQSALQIDYAIRWCRRIGERIRARDPAPIDYDEQPHDPNFEEAQTLLRELRPVVAGSKPSSWRMTMLARIDALLKAPAAPGKSGQEPTR
jgi:hypothetical protein